MSCYWVGGAYTCHGIYGDEIDEKYPNIKYTIPYEGPVYAMITLDENGAMIRGTRSTFQGPTPEERGLFAPESGWENKKIEKRHLTAEIHSRHLPFQK